jgi:hypothetical protein
VEWIERIEVRWPSGLVEELLDVAPDRYLTWTEGAADQAD